MKAKRESVNRPQSPKEENDATQAVLNSVEAEEHPFKEGQRHFRSVEERLKEANLQKDTLLGMLSHDLRGPLASIANALQVIRLSEFDKPRCEWATELIERQVQQLNRLVDDLKDISRIIRGNIKLNTEPLELSVVVARAVDISRPLIEIRKQQLDVTPTPESLWLKADKARLAQVVANVLNYAAKFSPEGSRINLSTHKLGKDVLIVVRGPEAGTSAALFRGVHDFLSQGETVVDPSQGSLGIGLSLVRNLVELHGGTVQTQSVGNGKVSEFIIRLPFLTDSEVKLQKAGKTICSSSHRRFLVVDDDVDSMEILVLMLQSLGHEVHVAHDGIEAVKKAQALRPEIIVLDIGLPMLDGYEVAQRIRKDPELQRTLLVALSGYDREEDRLRSRQAGFDRHFVKPLNMEELQVLLNSSVSTSCPR